MSRRIVPMLCLAFAVGCGRTAPQEGPGGAGAMPPADVKTGDPRREAGAADLRVRGQHPLARLDDRAAAGRRHRDSRAGAFRRPRARRPAAGADRSRTSSRHRLPASRRTRAARQADVAYAHAAARAPAEAVRGRRREPAGTGAGADRRAHGRRAARGHRSRASARAAWSWGTTGSGAPAAGIVGDVPVRTGDRVTNSTIITTIDQPRGSRLRLGAARARRPTCGPDCRCSWSMTAATVIAREPDHVHRAACRRCDAVGAGESATAQSSADSPGAAVRARADRLEQRSGADRSGGRSEPPRRPVLRVRGRARRAGPRGATEADYRSVRSSVTITSCRPV